MSHFVAPTQFAENPRNGEQMLKRSAMSRGAVPRRAGLDREFLRHFPRRDRRISIWCGPASRSMASIRRPASPTR